MLDLWEEREDVLYILLENVGENFSFQILTMYKKQCHQNNYNQEKGDVYKVNVKEISPNFTIGFVITSEDEFRELVNNYKEKKGDPGFDKLFVINNNQQKEPPINKLDIKYNFFSDK